MRWGERLYRLLLRAYPQPFRTTYEREMLLVFRDQWRERRGSAAGLWAEVVWDVVRSAPAIRLEQLRARPKSNLQRMGGTMKTMAILTVLVGALEAVSAMGEGWAGGAANTGHGAYWAAGVILMALAGTLLAGAGVALLRRGRRAAAWAELAALGCLAVVVLVRLVQPWMSIASMLLGIAFPAALLLFLRAGRGTDPSSRTVA